MSSPPIRAPSDHGAVLAVPPLAEVGSLIAANQRSFAPSWQEMRVQACREALSAAREYLRQSGEPVPQVQSDTLLVAGHQPEIFHPGVWVKNFALNGLARSHGLTPLNLVIDSDTAKSAAIHIPVLAAPNAEPNADDSWMDDPFGPIPPLPATQPPAHLVRTPFDDWKGEIPFEERQVINEALFGSFADRVASLTANWPFATMVGTFWDAVGVATHRTPLLGERLVAGRRALERRWRCANLEVPMSWLCRTPSFGRFVAGILHRLSDFHAAHNQALSEYRHTHHIESRNRPVAELIREGDWLEAPFWTWTPAAPRRERLFVRRTERRFELRSGQERWPNVPADEADFLTAWQKLAVDGYKIRSRALTTTMFARLFLSDAFIHGIGGAKYDELNDEIIRRFYRLEPPRYIVLSATLLLPFARTGISGADVNRLAAQRRDLWYNPERHLPSQPMATPGLLAQKASLLSEPATTKAMRRSHYQAIRKVNRELRAFLREPFARATQALQSAREQFEARQVLGRRDFAFCLYPEALLRPFCIGFLDGQ